MLSLHGTCSQSHGTIQSVSLENCYSISKTLNHKHIMHIVKVMYKNTKCKIPCLKEHQNRKIGDILEIGKEESATNSDPQKSNVIGS